MSGCHFYQGVSAVSITQLVSRVICVLSAINGLDFTSKK